MRDFEEHKLSEHRYQRKAWFLNLIPEFLGDFLVQIEVEKTQYAELPMSPTDDGRVMPWEETGVSRVYRKFILEEVTNESD